MNTNKTILILVALMAILGTASADETLYPHTHYQITGSTYEGLMGYNYIDVQLVGSNSITVPADGTKIMADVYLSYINADLKIYPFGYTLTLTPNIINKLNDIRPDGSIISVNTNTAGTIYLQADGSTIETQILVYAPIVVTLPSPQPKYDIRCHCYR